jgi:hypothetical protein
MLFGAWRALYQCDRCGKNLGATPGQPGEDLMALPRYFRRQRRRPNARRREYEASLRTRNWRDRRKRILQVARFRCRLRFPGVCTGRATEVHHLRYPKRLEDVTDRDLVAACKECNRHERSVRITRRVLGGR